MPVFSSQSARPVREASADPFYLAADHEHESRGFSTVSLYVWGLILVGGFFAVNTFSGDFAAMRRYRVDEAGLNAAFSLTENEKLFFIVLLLMIPAAVFWMLAAGRSLGTRLADRLSTLVADERRVRRAVAGLSVFVLVSVLAVSLFVLRDTPVSDDENVYAFQSRIFASGHLTLPSLDPPDRMFEDNVFLVNNGRIYGQYPFGHSLFLLPGMLVGYPRLMTLLAALFTVWGVFLLGRELYDTATGLLATFLLALSPMFLCMSSTLLSHPTTLLFLTWFGYCVVRALRTRTLRDAVLACVFFGLAFHVRSATTLVLAFPTAAVFALAHVVELRRQESSGGEVGRRAQVVLKDNLPRILVMALVLGVILGLYLLFNVLANGSPWITNYHAVWLGKLPYDSPFGFDKGAWKIIHTPMQGLKNLVNNFVKLDAWSLGWPIGFLPILALFGLRKARFIDYWLLLPIVANFFAFFFYFWPGISDTGPVLYYELLLPIVLLAARGILATAEWLKGRLAPGTARGYVTAFVVASTIFALATTTQTFVRALSLVADHVNEPYRLLADRGVDSGVVFMDYYVKGDFQDSWVAGRNETNPALGDKLHFVLNFGPELDRAFMERHFPGQPASVLWWSKDGDPRLVPLEDYSESYVVRNFPAAR